MANPGRTIQFLQHLDAPDYHNHRAKSMRSAMPEMQHPDRLPPLLLESLSRFGGKKGLGDEVQWTIEQRATTDYYTPYTFSAKGRNPETGYSYFCARYYDPNVSVWLSVKSSISFFLILYILLCSSCNHSTTTHKVDQQKDSIKLYTISFNELLTFPDLVVKIESPVYKGLDSTQSSYWSYYLTGLYETMPLSQVNSQEIIRFMIIRKPNPLLIKLTKYPDNQCYLLFIVSDGNCEYVGKPTLYIYKKLTLARFNEMKSLYISNGLDTMHHNPPYNYDVSGCSEMLFESVINKKYQTIVRIAPDHTMRHQNDSLQIKALINIFNTLLKQVISERVDSNQIYPLDVYLYK